jgi:intracellular septation protein A
MTETTGETVVPATVAPAPDGDFHIPEVSTRTILLGSGPRFARDAFGPMLVFYAGWKVSGLLVGIVASTIASFVAYRWERTHDRPGLMARIGLGLVLLQAAVGIVSDSTVAYLAQPVLITGVYGLAFLASALIGRPLAGTFATEMYPFPDEVKSSDTFKKAFSRISLAWGAYLVVRSVARMATLTRGDVDAFIVMNLVTGVPLTALLMGWSVWYAVRYFRNSAEFGEAIRLMEAGAL